MKIIEMNSNWAFSVRFYFTLSPSSFPCLLLRVELCQLSGINRIRKKSSRYVYLHLALYCLLSPLSVQTTGIFFCHSCLSLSIFFFFFTSSTVNASESRAGCFRYHTESSELSKVRVANTQCRKKITKYDAFSGRLCSHCETNRLLSTALGNIFHA